MIAGLLLSVAMSEPPPVYQQLARAPLHQVLTDEQFGVLEDLTSAYWKRCIANTATAWAPRAETPSEIADGAFGQCWREEQTMTNLLRSPRVGRGPISTAVREDIIGEFVQSIHRTWRPRLVARVIAARQAGVRKPRTK